MKFSVRETGTLPTVAAICLLAGCDSSGSGGTVAIGYLSLGVSDAPVHDAVKVCIAFDRIELQPVDGERLFVDLGGVQNVNLLEFQGTNAAPLLFSEPLDAGEYQFLRLGANAMRGGAGGTGDDPMSVECQGDQSYIAFDDGTVHNLYIPSGEQRGMQFNGPIVVPVNETANFTVEFDLMKSLATPPGLDPDMILRPTAKLVNNLFAGTLIGEVSEELATAVDEASGTTCAPSVFLFNDGVMPNPNALPEEPGDPNDSVASAMVQTVDNGDGTTSYAYSIGFVSAGDYEAAFTCDGEIFVPEEGKPATIVANEITEVSFP